MSREVRAQTEYTRISFEIVSGGGFTTPDNATEAQVKLIELSKLQMTGLEPDQWLNLVKVLKVLIRDQHARQPDGTICLTRLLLQSMCHNTELGAVYTVENELRKELEMSVRCNTQLNEKLTAEKVVSDIGKQNNADLKKSLTMATTQLKTSEELNTELLNALDSAVEELASAKADLDLARTDKQTASELSEILDTQLKNSNEAMAQLQNALDSAVQELASAKADLDLARTEKQAESELCETLNTQLTDCKEVSAKQQTDLSSVQKELNLAKAELHLMRTDILRNAASLAESKEVSAKLRKELDSVQEELRELTKKFNGQPQKQDKYKKSI